MEHLVECVPYAFETDNEDGNSTLSTDPDECLMDTKDTALAKPMDTDSGHDDHDDAPPPAAPTENQNSGSHTIAKRSDDRTSMMNEMEIYCCKIFIECSSRAEHQLDQLEDGDSTDDDDHTRSPKASRRVGFDESQNQVYADPLRTHEDLHKTWYKPEDYKSFVVRLQRVSTKQRALEDDDFVLCTYHNMNKLLWCLLSACYPAQLRG